MSIKKQNDGQINPQITNTIYVRTTGSDDSRNPYSLATPYRTVQRALMDIPAVHQPGVAYSVDATDCGTEVFPDNFRLPAFSSTIGIEYATTPAWTSVRPALEIRATPKLVDLPNGENSVLSSDIASAVADSVTSLMTITLTTPRPSWAAGALKGKFFKSALGTFFYNALIADSTSTTLKLCLHSRHWLSANFEIAEPSYTMEGGGANGIMLGNSSSACFTGIKFRNRGTGSDLYVSNSWTQLRFCDLRNVDMQCSGSAPIFIGKTYLHDYTGYDSFTGDYFVFFGSLLKNADLEGQLTASMHDAYQTIFENCSPIESRSYMAFAHGVCSYNGFSYHNCEINGTIPGTVYATGELHGIKLHGGHNTIKGTRISNCGGSGIKLKGGTLVLDKVAGTGNAGIGVEVTNGGTVVASGAMTITGTGGDFKVGALAAGSWAVGAQNVPDYEGVSATGSRLVQS